MSGKIYKKRVYKKIKSRVKLFLNGRTRTRTLDPLITYHYDFHRPWRVCGLDDPFALETRSVGGRRLVSTPFLADLARDYHSDAGFPDFDVCFTRRFPAEAPIKESAALPTELYARFTRPVGLEPTTYRLEGGCSIQLS